MEVLIVILCFALLIHNMSISNVTLNNLFAANSDHKQRAPVPAPRVTAQPPQSKYFQIRKNFDKDIIRISHLLIKI